MPRKNVPGQLHDHVGTMTYEILDLIHQQAPDSPDRLYGLWSRQIPQHRREAFDPLVVSKARQALGRKVAK